MSSTEEEISELQSRMAAVELLVIDILAQKIAENPATGHHTDGLLQSNEMIRSGMQRDGTSITNSVHYRFLECLEQLLVKARSHSRAFEQQAD